LALPTLSASPCSCRLVSLIIISPHGRPRQLGTKFFLWVSYSPPRPHSTSQPSCSFSSVWLDWHHTHSPSFCVCVCQGNTTPTRFCMRIIEDLCTRLSAVHIFFRSCGLL
jgi:hypothetical protein